VLAAVFVVAVAAVLDALLLDGITTFLSLSRSV
jgi:hypothetical protein